MLFRENNPPFCCFIECTSAISSDVEGRMYEALKSMDITLITISLRYETKQSTSYFRLNFKSLSSRPSLAKYHKQMLTLHGPTGSSPGKWILARVGTPEERLSVQHEIKVLEEKLKEVDGWETRVGELEALLGVQEVQEDMRT